MALLVGAALSACGGSTAERGPSAPSPPSGAGPSDEENAASVPVAPRPRCADGTCFSCGDGVCPVGFFCDEGAVSGPACAWLPACGADAGCSCLEKALRGCRCDAEGAALHVRCDGPG